MDMILLRWMRARFMTGHRTLTLSVERTRAHTIQYNTRAVYNHNATGAIVRDRYNIARRTPPMMMMASSKNYTASVPFARAREAHLTIIVQITYWPVLAYAHHQYIGSIKKRRSRINCRARSTLAEYTHTPSS